MLLLSREDIKKVFTMKDAIEADAMRRFAPISRRQSMRDASCSCLHM